ncbi:MAG: geranylgeranylglyceryl/heptaprenylglyceryl phosphate synthase [Halovenus sp.]
MSLSDIVRRLESAASTAFVGSKTLLGLDTNPVPSEWDHITKVDPEGEKRLPLAYPLYLSQTSAVSVGGSRDVTYRNTEETFDLVNMADVPAFHEPSAASHVTDRTREQGEFLAVPEVLNGDSQALVGTLGEGIDYVREELSSAIVEDKLGVSLDGLFGDRVGNFAAGYMMQQAVFEAYIIMNLDSAAAREANVTEDDLIDPETAKQRALAAEYHLDSEVIYLEYSGRFGGEEALDILEAIDDAVTWPRLWYGGGLDSRENVNAVRDAGADAVVVGDVFHDIAEEERKLFRLAVDEFATPPAADDLRAFLAGAVDIEETSAARYLSTVPSVTEPAATAAEYLVAGVGIALSLREVAAELSDPDERDIERALASDGIPGEAAFADVLGGGAGTVARTLGHGLLAERFDVDEPSAAGRHLALDL